MHISYWCSVRQTLFAVVKLDTPKWDIFATGVAVYFESKLRELNLQT